MRRSRGKIFYLTLNTPIPQNGQTHSNNSLVCFCVHYYFQNLLPLQMVLYICQQHMPANVFKYCTSFLSSTQFLTNFTTHVNERLYQNDYQHCSKRNYRSKLKSTAKQANTPTLSFSEYFSDFLVFTESSFLICCWRFLIKTPFTFWDMRAWDMWKVCLQTFRNNRIC